MPTKRRSSPEHAIARAVAFFDGNQTALARAAGIAQQNLNRAVRRGRVSPNLALGIHRATNGVVGAHELRPDLWSSALHVPPWSDRNHGRRRQ
jgi:DNA-binding transcriptional regulator YdaS (Cro superfamily)